MNVLNIQPTSHANACVQSQRLIKQTVPPVYLPTKERMFHELGTDVLNAAHVSVLRMVIESVYNDFTESKNNTYLNVVFNVFW